MGFAIGHLSEEERRDSRLEFEQMLRNSVYGDKTEKLMEVLDEYREGMIALINRFEDRLAAEVNTSLGELNAVITHVVSEMNGGGA